VELWVILTIGAAAAQTLRFMAQRHLRATALSTTGATLARFLYSAPLVAALVALMTTTGEVQWPPVTAAFLVFALGGGLAQILATLCVLALFGARNFAVGITFKKTEVLLTAAVGYAVLGDRVSPAGMMALCLGFAAVLFLAEAGGVSLSPARLVNRATALGLASGLFFAFSAVGYRGAMLELGEGSLAFRAAVTLALVTAFQSLVMMVWMRLREPGQITLVLRHWRLAGLVGVFSMAGSLGWFAAFGLQSAAYVFVLGQIELIFSILAAVLVFGERITAREYLGMALLTLSIVLLVAVV